MDYQILDTNNLLQATPKFFPFPYLCGENVIAAQYKEAIVADFPKISKGGSFPLTNLKFGPMFAQIIKDLESQIFRKYIADKLELNLDSYPSVVTVRGLSRKKDGRIHTDTTSKKVTVLLYFNLNWNEPGGNLRILNDGSDIKNVACEVSAKFGNMLAFKVTDNCWHGYTGYEGQRLSLQLNYVEDIAAKEQQLAKHGFTAKIKSLFSTV